MDRREFLKLGAAAAAGSTVAGVTINQAGATAPRPPGSDVEEVTIAELQDRMTRGRLTSRELVRKYLDRIDAIDRRGPRLNSVIEVNPDAERIARDLDRERREGHVRGPLHGIPILLKDNVDTADATQTATGSLALVGPPPAQDATVAALLREAGAVLLGKAGLSEFANFRGFSSSSGWSGRGGQVNNPYVLDRNPCGSSSGSGSATAASLCAAAIATETDGSIVCPAHANGVVGIKPTVGLTSRAGVIPIAAAQDTVGPHGRTVADAVAVLGATASVEPDPRDPATASNRDLVFRDYTQFLDPNGLQGKRIGVARAGVTGYSEETDAVFEANIIALRDAGAVVVDPADIPTIEQIGAGVEEITVLVFEFKRDLNAYLATRTGLPALSMAEIIAFNLANEDAELKWFGQQWLELSESEPFTEAEYLAALAEARRIGGPDGIDAVLAQHNLDAIVAPTGSPAWPSDLVNGDHFLGASSGPAAVAGYPLITVPAGDAFGLPVGLTFMGTAYSEPTLIALAHGFEQATMARRRPEYLPTLPTDGRRPRSPRQAALAAIPSPAAAPRTPAAVIYHL
ncbi:MAG: amidase [Acidimicrobiales bacterium]